jgi:hypothetical protein
MMAGNAGVVLIAIDVAHLLLRASFAVHRNSLAKASWHDVMTSISRHDSSRSSDIVTVMLPCLIAPRVCVADHQQAVL